MSTDNTALPLDMDAIRAKWTLVCPPCDAGYPAECTHPDEDPRRVILDLCNALATVTAGRDEARRTLTEARRGLESDGLQDLLLLTTYAEAWAAQDGYPTDEGNKAVGDAARVLYARFDALRADLAAARQQAEQAQAERDLLGRQQQSILDLCHSIERAGGASVVLGMVYDRLTTDPADSDEPLYEDFSWGTDGSKGLAELAGDGNRPIYRLDRVRLGEFVEMAVDTYRFLTGGPDHCGLCGRVECSGMPGLPNSCMATPAAAPHTVWDHYGPCGYCGVTTGPCLNPDDSAPWPIERRVPAPKPHSRRQLRDAAAPKSDEPLACAVVPWVHSPHGRCPGWTAKEVINASFAAARGPLPVAAPLRAGRDGSVWVDGIHHAASGWGGKHCQACGKPWPCPIAAPGDDTADGTADGGEVTHG